ncbi:hypothetical protein CDD83_2988 [Cordyceps sp. RAO-2017]|nr:hypothetical protein CDD83_2988 [Cordyceps sp. RAO-2017]
MTSAASYVSRDSDSNFNPGRHGRHPSDISDTSSGTSADVHGNAPAAAAELEAEPYVAELPSTPSTMASPAAWDERCRSVSSASVPSPARPWASLAKRPDGWAGPMSAARLDVVDEEMHSHW